MEVGQLNNYKIGAVIQARMSSTRLPGKILYPLPYSSQKPLIAWPICSLKKSKLINTIIIATSLNKENEPLREVAIQNSIIFFAGSEDNVLSRFIEVSRNENLDVIVRITADNPIIDEKLIDQLIILHVEGNFDYSYSTGLPLGMNIEIVNAKKLFDIYNQYDLTDQDLEHVTSYFKRNINYKVLKHDFDIGPIDDLRLTVDYASDYALLNLIAEESIKSELTGIELIQNLKAKMSWIFNINNENYQIKLFNSLEEELSYSLEILKKFDLNRAVDFLKSKVTD
jgi:spore coat polysaccharide biosynthesis protein SpsF